eukprot:2987640-Pyramimonas_sp.AAC.2
MDLANPWIGNPCLRAPEIRRGLGTGGCIAASLVHPALLWSSARTGRDRPSHQLLLLILLVLERP